MKTKYIELQSFLREKIRTIEDYKKATSIAVGVAISRMITLPTGDVGDVSDAFDTELRFTVMNLAGEFNEEIVIDIDLTFETARGMWLMRYSAAHPNLSVPILPMGTCGFLNKICNAHVYINPQILAYLDKYSELMVVLVNRITIVMTNKEE